MTALEIKNDVILFDSGIFLPAIVGVEEKEKIPTEKGMRNLGALPDDIYLEKHGLRNKVRAILVSHAHLDHVGALPYIAYRYKAPIVSTPFTIEFIKVLEKSNEIPKSQFGADPDIRSFSRKDRAKFHELWLYYRFLYMDRIFYGN